jgi:flagellar biosynthetic protein FliP
LLLTVLSLLPSILIMLTGFTRIIIVLSLIRNGLGLQQMPPNQVMIGLALFLTLFVMTPVIDDIKVNAYEPYIAQEITQEQAIDRAMKPIRAIAISGHNTEVDIERSRKVGFLDHIAKPLVAEELTAAIERAVTKPRPTEARH